MQLISVHQDPKRARLETIIGLTMLGGGPFLVLGMKNPIWELVGGLVMISGIVLIRIADLRKYPTSKQPKAALSSKAYLLVLIALGVYRLWREVVHRLRSLR